MSTFQSTIEKIRIEPHPNADRLDLAVVGGYRCIVGKDQYKTGDLVAYIPEQAIVPDDVIETLNLTGKLGGRQKNRVRAIKLRNVVSQGLTHPLNKGRLAEHSLSEGDDVTDILGLIKYEPEIPTNMSGEVEVNPEYTLKYDIENIKKFPYLIQDTDEIVVTEKIHGTFMCAAHNADDHDWRITSKGLGAKGLVFKNNKMNQAFNLYVKTFNDNRSSFEWIVRNIRNGYGSDVSVFILGEVYGKGVQDLTYGRQNKGGFAIFDIMISFPSGRRWFLQWKEMNRVVDQHLDIVPEIYTGPFQDFDPTGSSALCDTQIREGLVIRTAEETERDGERCIVKSISDDYLFRKNGTEYN